MATLSTHVLDTALGRPAVGLDVVLFRFDGELFVQLNRQTTDDDGRVKGDRLAPDGLAPGTYQLVFETGPYLGKAHGKGFFPFAPIVFEITDDTHYHVPLLLSPYGLSTYRGS
ncbi:MAG TPA: hydroxyisourate hydrolase [Myxococcota bacterium]|nr:hydroxyisourate hydrolase [Myxococcota bacterium]